MRIQMPSYCDQRRRFQSGFTLAELMVALGISGLLVTVFATFIMMVARSTAGIVKQSVVNGQAGRSSEFLFSRIRFATSVTTSNSGDILVLGFDDNFLVDSDGDKKAYNDKDHYEWFIFTNGDGDDTTTDDNRLLYKARSNIAATNIMISSGIAKLSGKPVFGVTNQATVLLNYALRDSYSGDGYQQCDIQTKFVARNRPDSSTVISIVP